MTAIAIVYFSASGNTAQLAEAVAEGAAARHAVQLLRLDARKVIAARWRDEELLELLDAAPAIVFGSPTFMGGPAAAFKAFADASSERWERQAWADKWAGGFTSGSCPNGNQDGTLQYFATLAAQHGMHWCNLSLPGGYDAQGRNRLGTQWGASAWVEEGKGLDERDLATARHLGERIAARLQRPT